MTDQADFILKLIDKMSGPARGISKSLGKVGSIAESVGGSIKVAAGVAGAALAVAGVFAAKTVVEFADFAQGSEFAFNQLAKNGASGAKIFEHVRDLSMDLGLSIQDTSKNFTKLLAAQFNPTLATDIVKMGADLRVLGARAEDVSGAVTAITQIKSTGRLQGDELNQLVNAGVSAQLVFESLAKQMGKTVPEVIKLKEAGKIDADTAIAGILDAVKHKVGEKELGEAGKRFAENTLSGMAGVFKAEAENVMITLGQKVAPALSETFSAIGKEITGFLRSEEGAAFLDNLANGIKSVAGFVKDAIPAVKEFIKSFASGFGTTFEAVKESLAIFSGPDGKGTIVVVKMIASSLGQLAAIAIGAAGAFGIAVAAVVTGASFAWEVVKAAVIGVVNTIGGLIFPIVDFFANLGAIFDATGLSWGEKFLAIGKAMVMGLVNGIKALASLPIDAMRNIGFSAIDAAKSALGIASPSKVFEGIGENVTAGFEKGIANFDAVGPRVGSMTAANSNGFAAGGMGGGSGQITIPITIQFSGTGTPDENAKALARELRLELAATLDDLMLATG